MTHICEKPYTVWGRRALEEGIEMMSSKLFPNYRRYQWTLHFQHQIHPHLILAGSLLEYDSRLSIDDNFLIPSFGYVIKLALEAITLEQMGYAIEVNQSVINGFISYFARVKKQSWLRAGRSSKQHEAQHKKW